MAMPSLNSATASRAFPNFRRNTLRMTIMIHSFLAFFVPSARDQSRWRRCSVLVPVGGRHDGHAVRVGNPEGNWRADRREFTKLVVGKQRQVRLSRASVDHPQDTLVRVNIRRPAGRDAGGHQAVYKEII